MKTITIYRLWDLYELYKEFKTDDLKTKEMFIQNRVEMGVEKKIREARKLIFKK